MTLLQKKLLKHKENAFNKKCQAIANTGNISLERELKLKSKHHYKKLSNIMG